MHKTKLKGPIITETGKLLLEHSNALESDGVRLFHTSGRTIIVIITVIIYQ
jgi:hypothetical protein